MSLLQLLPKGAIYFFQILAWEWIMVESGEMYECIYIHNSVIYILEWMNSAEIHTLSENWMKFITKIEQDFCWKRMKFFFCQKNAQEIFESLKEFFFSG